MCLQEALADFVKEETERDRERERQKERESKESYTKRKSKTKREASEVCRLEHDPAYRNH